MPTGTCGECGYAWDLSLADARMIVESGPRLFGTLFDGRAFAAPPPGVWSAGGYVWHMVDMLGLNVERLCQLRIDPTHPLTPWDPDVAAADRHYESLSASVGLARLQAITDDWLAELARVPAGAAAPHPYFAKLDATDIARLNAHEVVHHVLDVRRQLAP
jgi:DinB superfamily